VCCTCVCVPACVFVDAYRNIQRNYQALLKPDPGIPGMAVLNGMRVLAIMGVVLGHTFAFMSQHVTNGGLAQLVGSRMSAIGIIGNQHVQQNGTSVAFLSVDTFFFFSGFLAFYSMLTSILTQKMETPKTFAIGSAKWTYAAVLHRYMRLTPMYFFLLMVFMYILPSLGDGPDWKSSIEGSGPTGPIQ
jgi:peptidoglycan/LPS O-acetylase OafA/YrhL